MKKIAYIMTMCSDMLQANNLTTEEKNNKVDFYINLIAEEIPKIYYDKMFDSIKRTSRSTCNSNNYLFAVDYVLIDKYSNGKLIDCRLALTHYTKYTSGRNLVKLALKTGNLWIQFDM
jgi:hypothetical protein